MQFFGGADFSTHGVSPERQPVRGLNQTNMHRLKPICLTVQDMLLRMVGREAPKRSEGKILEGVCSHYNRVLPR